MRGLEDGARVNDLLLAFACAVCAAVPVGAVLLGYLLALWLADARTALDDYEPRRTSWDPPEGPSA